MSKKSDKRLTLKEALIRKIKKCVEDGSIKNIGEVYTHMVNQKAMGFDTRNAARKWWKINGVPLFSVESEKYTYNSDKDEYIFHPGKGSSLTHSIVISGEKIREIQKAYSNTVSSSDTITEISMNLAIPRNILTNIIRALGITHDSLPFTDESILNIDNESLLEETIDVKKFNLYQDIQKQNWAKIRESAKKWDELESGRLNVIEKSLEKFDFCIRGGKEIGETKITKGRRFCVGLTDNHIGDIFSSAFTEERFNKKIAVEMIRNLSKKIKSLVSSRKEKFASCEIFALGDYLNSCLDGLTRKGTHLRNDIINEELFDLGLSVLIAFVDDMVDIFGQVNFRGVMGNHDSTLGYAVYRATEKAFRNDKRVKFYITNEFIANCRINNSYIFYSHAGHDKIKFALPKGTKLEAYISNLLLDNIDNLKGCKGRYFLCGHTHAFRQEEMNNGVDFFTLSATVPATEHSRTLGFRTKSRATCLIIGEDYIDEVLHMHLN